MKCPRLFVTGPLPSSGPFQLDDDAAAHLRVLRLRPGNPLTLFDGRGGETVAALASVDRRAVHVEISHHVDVERESPLSVTLVQGVSKGDRMDWTIQKAVELGVTRIVPVFTERSVVNLNGDRLEKKLGHWRGVIRSACEQCGRNRVPELADAVPLQQSERALGVQGLRLLADPAGGRSLNAFTRPAGVSIALLVGPEGGLSDAELEWARDRGYQPLLLGPRVLRTETAGVTALAGLQALWGDLG
ncbi:MAG: 16S rRNA (uracil(1498)-N(3))-methyltransferase [Ectothiorhodospiraceae bacterium]|nr:16S rRNA (uracil(1498)-N(3))-methyltransferase [Ectothiorhodospiraceae bacterium]MCH8502737.1 16S rRNA (uracil(1498)-N(3))-methyltransferase [Ectothiorhodospiraceae bacterium]